MLAGAAVGLGLALSVRMVGALVAELARREVSLGVAGALGLGMAHAILMAAVAALAVAAADSGSLLGPLLRWSSASWLGIIALDGLARTVLLGRPGIPSSARLPVTPLRTYLQVLAIGSLDPRALSILLGLLVGLPTVGLTGDDRVPFAIGGIGIVVTWPLVRALLAAGPGRRAPEALASAVGVAGPAVLLLVAAAIAAA